MMAPISFANLAHKYGGVLIQPDVQLRALSTDSRNLKPGEVFVALKGDSFDGHQYLQSALDQGATALVTEKVLPQKALRKSSQWVVKNSLRALGYIALENRQAYKGKLIALTGSNGKTSVKEMIATILRKAADVHATRGNLNNHIGVPLTLLGLNPEHQYAVVEMGASGLGEINYLTQMAKPDVALVNNVGDAHVGEFGGIRNIEIGKGEIYNGLAHSGLGVVNLDSRGVERYQEKLADRHMLTFSLAKQHADIFAVNIRLEEQASEFEICFKGHKERVRLAVPGEHMVANALAAASCCLAVGTPLHQIVNGLAEFAGVSGRVQQIELPSGARLIDDSYNASPSSVRAAIDLLVNRQGIKILVLGDMAELGNESHDLHKQIGIYAAEQGVNHLLVLGEHVKYAAAGFADSALGGRAQQSELFGSAAELSLRLNELLTADSCALVKGSRSARMEDVVNLIRDRGE